MKEKLFKNEVKLDIFHDKYIDHGFHDAVPINLIINKDKFHIRILEHYYYLKEYISEGNDLLKDLDEDGHILLDMIINKIDNISFTRFVNDDQIINSQILSIDPIYKNKKIIGFKFDFFTNQYFTTYTIYGSDFYYRIITYFDDKNETGDDTNNYIYRKYSKII